HRAPFEGDAERSLVAAAEIGHFFDAVMKRRQNDGLEARRREDPCGKTAQHGGDPAAGCEWRFVGYEGDVHCGFQSCQTPESEGGGEASRVRVMRYPGLFTRPIRSIGILPVFPQTQAGSLCYVTT